MANEVDYSLVLPSYLEEENLRLLLPRIKEELSKIPGKSEVLVIDTVQAMDATEKVCADEGVTYINRGPSNTFGDAVRTGVERARGRWVIFMDADGSHAPEFIPKLIAETTSSDVVIASRYIDGGYTENEAALRIMSQVLNWTYALILNLRVKDVSNSFKIYRADLLKALKLKCQNFDIVEEILFKIVQKNKGVRIKEIPFSFKKRMFGETKRSLLLFILTYFVTIIRLRFSSLK